MGEHAFFQADHEHERELQAFRRMNRHQRHSVVFHVAEATVHASIAYAGIVIAGYQRGEIREVFHRFVALCQIHQLLQVLQPALRLGNHMMLQLLLGLTAEVAEIAAFFQQQIEHSSRPQAETASHRIAKRNELADAFASLSRDSCRLSHPQSFSERQMLQGGERGELGDSLAAHAALGSVDRTGDALLISRIHHRPHVGDRISYLHALEEADSAHHFVGNVKACQGVFYQHALEVGAIQHGEIVGREARVALKGGSDFVGHPIRLVSVAPRRISQHLAPSADSLTMRPQHLASTMRVIGDHLVGSVQDVLRGTVVFLQQHGLDVGQLGFKSADVADVGASEAIDGLVGVSHHADVRPLAAKLQDDAVLRRVGVLILVHQNVLKLVLMPLQHIGMPAKQLVRLHQQVVKIHRPGIFQLLLIHAKDGGDLLRVEDITLLGDFGEFARRKQIVLGFADRVAKATDRQPLRIYPQLAEHKLEDPIGVAHVVDGKLLRVAEL